MKSPKSHIFAQKRSLNVALWTLLALPAACIKKKDDFSSNNDIIDSGDMEFLKLEPKPKLVVFDLGKFQRCEAWTGGGGRCIWGQE